VASTAARRAKQTALPRSATITIREQHPSPSDEVEVTPDGGRVHFENKDKKEYRLRLWKPKTEPNAGIDILLPAGGRVTVVIKEKDVFEYSVMSIAGGEAMSGNGGGPIKN
jgi:hypothetical protein